MRLPVAAATLASALRSENRIEPRKTIYPWRNVLIILRLLRRWSGAFEGETPPGVRCRVPLKHSTLGIRYAALPGAAWWMRLSVTVSLLLFPKRWPSDSTLDFFDIYKFSQWDPCVAEMWTCK